MKAHERKTGGGAKQEQPHAMRGVTRPGHEMGGEEMSLEHRGEMVEAAHHQTLWLYWTVVMLGFWMVLSPLTFDYGRAPAMPGGGREVWLSLEARINAMVISDVVSGLLLIVLGWRSLTPRRPVSVWGCCLVGVWLNLAPFVFWSPSELAYLNGTLVGAWVIALTVLIPEMPDMMMFMKMGAAVPPGWSYNPSSWPQRWIMIALGFAGWMVSRYLGAFQLGYIDTAWDPFFGASTERVLNSGMSRMWPISDAAFGSFAYTLEFLMGFMGDRARWRTMPWMVALFGFLVIPLGLVHIFLVISQPVTVGAWCTLCLLAAAIMLPMIPLEGDEVVAMGQHLVGARRRGESLWDTFWKGGSAEGSSEDERTPELAAMPQRPGEVLRASTWGMSVPWTLAVSTAIGAAVMFVPGTLGVEKPASDVMHLAGALVVTASVVAMGEVFRAARWLNVLLGVVLIGAPWLVGGGATVGNALASAAGIAVIALAVPGGAKTERYGAWDAWIL